MGTNPKVMTSTGVISSAPCIVKWMVWTGGSTGASLQVNDVSGGNRLMKRAGQGTDMNVLPEPSMFATLYLHEMTSGELEIYFG